MKNFSLLALLMALAGCSTTQLVSQVVTPLVGRDLERTAQMAEKYGKPEVKQCADLLITSLKGLDSDQAKLDELLKEDVDGILSAALKAELIREYVAKLNDPSRADALKKAFDTNCAQLGGQILFQVLRDAQKFGRKGL